MTADVNEMSCSVNGKILMSRFFLFMSSPSFKHEIEGEGEGCWIWFVKEIAIATV